ncbi:cell division FtsA domain-containing protein [Massilia sp. H-1]|nr:cell division FtsA domain-containing protein [Massilia sp. H-1]
MVLIDIGGGTTDIAVFSDGAIRHTAVIPIHRRPDHQRHRDGTAHADLGSGRNQDPLQAWPSRCWPIRTSRSKCRAWATAARAICRARRWRP